MNLVDFTDEAARWLHDPSPAGAFQRWLEHAPEWIGLALSGIGVKPGSREWDTLVQGSLPPSPRPLIEFLRQDEWRSFVTSSLRQTSGLLGESADLVTVVVLLGLGLRNAAPGYWRGRGFAFLFLEHFLPLGSSTRWLDLGPAAIPIWLAHEIGHAVRYCLPGTASPVPAATQGDDCWSFWDRVESLPLAERFLDEGLATAFSRAVVPEADDEEILGMSAESLDWLEAHAEQLLHRRLAEWDLARDDPPLEWVRDALWGHAERAQPPWTLDRPPPRWGYFVGERFFVPDREGDWPHRLSQPCRWGLGDR